MPICIQCRTDVGFIGSFSFNKITGRCNKCESEIRMALMRFRAAFLSFCSDGILTHDKWKRLLVGATNERLNVNEAVAFIYLDALNLLNRLLTFAAANGSITDEDERN